MTMQSSTPYKAPTGFYQNFTFDKSGQLFADGKELNGVRLDVNTLKGAEAAKNPLDLNGAPKATLANPFLNAGGSISGLSTDANGNVYAMIAAPKTAKPTGVGAYGLGWQGPSSTPAMVSGVADKGTGPLDWIQSAPMQQIKLSGVQLDPERFSQSGSGPLGDNQLYLRPDDSGAYFAQVNKGNQVVAYAYSALQQATAPVGGPDTPTNTGQRRQGGNAGGGVSATSSAISLLGD